MKLLSTAIIFPLLLTSGCTTVSRALVQAETCDEIKKIIDLPDDSEDRIPIIHNTLKNQAKIEYDLRKCSYFKEPLNEK